MRFSKVLFVIGFSLALCNTTMASSPALDTIFKVEGKVMVVDVSNVTSAYVNFYVPGSAERFTLPRKEIHKIWYGNGKKEEFNPPIVLVIDNESWKAVWLTDKKKDVADMYKRGKFTVHAKPVARGSEASKNNATILAQKKAAAMKGEYIHVTRREITGGYNNPKGNGYLIEGVVYGLEPLEEETN